MKTSKYFLFLFLIALLFSNKIFAKGQQNICVASLNSLNEEEVFRKHLKDPKQFNVVNLIDGYENSTDPFSSPDKWFKDACEKQTQCDVLMISAHFAESFFGARTGLGLGLDEMEKQSCNKKCNGLLKKPKEVFLMGCNTLATKAESDNRDIESYIQDLIGDSTNSETNEKISYAAAERIAMARYGSLGASLKERMRNVFGKASQIYGFNDSGPTGASVEQHFDKYFDNIKNDLKKNNPGIKNTSDAYAQHLEVRNVENLTDQLGRINDHLGLMNNPILANSLGNTNFSQCSGLAALSENDPEYELRKNICKLYDNTNYPKPSDKLAAGLELLEKVDFEKYLPTVTKFIRENYKDLISDNKSLKLLKEFAERGKINSKLQAVLDNLRINSRLNMPANQLDIMITQKLLGFIDDEKLEDEVKKTLGKGHPDPAKDRFKNLNPTNHELLCTLKKSGALTMTVDHSYFNQNQLESANGVHAMSCFQTTDSKISDRALSAIRKGGSNHDITKLLIGSQNLPGRDEEFLDFARKQVNQSKSDTVLMPAHNLVLYKSKSNDEKSSSLKSLMVSENHQILASNFVTSNTGFKSEIISSLSKDLLIKEATELSQIEINLKRLKSDREQLLTNSSNNSSLLSENQIATQVEADKQIKSLNKIRKLSSIVTHTAANDSKVWGALTKELGSKNSTVNFYVAQQAARVGAQNNELINWSIQNSNRGFRLPNLAILGNSKLNQVQYKKLKKVLDNWDSKNGSAAYYRSILNNQKHLNKKKISGESIKYTCQPKAKQPNSLSVFSSIRHKTNLSLKFFAFNNTFYAKNNLH